MKCPSTKSAADLGGAAGGERGSEHEVGESGWRWANWDGDENVLGDGGRDGHAGCNDGNGDASESGPSATSSASASGPGAPIAGTPDADVLRGGAGIDTLKFDECGILDLSLLARKVAGDEQADRSGTGSVELKLTFQDLLTMTDGGHQLTIIGGSRDKVSADFTGHDVAVADMGSFTRYVIDGAAATLDIDNNVQKNIIGI